MPLTKVSIRQPKGSLMDSKVRFQVSSFFAVQNTLLTHVQHSSEVMSQANNSNAHAAVNPCNYMAQSVPSNPQADTSCLQACLRVSSFDLKR